MPLITRYRILVDGADLNFLDEATARQKMQIATRLGHHTEWVGEVSFTLAQFMDR